MDVQFSIVTSVLNGAACIGDCLAGLSSQIGVGLEHVIVDGGSTDATLAIVAHNGVSTTKVLHAPGSSIYEALNLGVAAAVGEVVGVLGSDDYYPERNTLRQVWDAMAAGPYDAGYGDALFVAREDTSVVRRRWIAGPFDATAFRRGWAPPHMAFFVRRSIFERFGAFNTALPLAADYEFMLRVLYRERASTVYVPITLAVCREGGASGQSLQRHLRAHVEVLQSWRVAGYRYVPPLVLLKPLRKMGQFVHRPS